MGYFTSKLTCLKIIFLQNILQAKQIWLSGHRLRPVTQKVTGSNSAVVIDVVYCVLGQGYLSMVSQSTQHKLSTSIS